MNRPCSIELLGGLAIQHGDRAITRFRTQKTAALLAYLAFYLHRSHPREEIIELLWPDTEIEDGRASLRTALASLRHQLEPPGTPYNTVLIADRANVRLNPEVVSTDAARFEAAVQSAKSIEEASKSVHPLEQAVELYRGPLLPGFYEDWVIRERERLEQMYIATLSQLSIALAETGDLSHAVSYAQRRVHADPLAEAAHCDLIRLLMQSGQAAAARSQYEELERVLRSELDVAPSVAAQALESQLPAAKQRELRTGGAAVRPSLVLTTTPGPFPVITQESPEPEPPPSGIPLYLAPFFGREDEVSRLVELLRRQSDSDAREPSGEARAPALTRLVTLTGPGGCGKTRLAVESARGLAGAFRGRIWFVPLADIPNESLILEEVLSALGLPGSTKLAPLEQIKQTLNARPSLLILDNFEHLVEAGAQVVMTLLNQLPELSCMITSRQRLEIAGEREFPVKPLGVPTMPGTPERLLDFASVRLFVERAQASRPDFQITRENAESIASLCERLEGIPLAIELAAAWAAVLTPSQMLTRMEERFRFLATRRKGLPARQRSLRDTIEWSYRLLPPELQRFFDRLSVFRGSWSLEAAEAACDEPMALELVTQLQARSLIVSEELAEVMRFRLLETLRDYARERLVERGEEGATRRRHLDYFLRFAEDASARIHGVDQHAVLGALETEHDNLRAALASSLEGGGPADTGPTDEVRELGLRLAVALTPFWWVRGHQNEGIQWIEQLLRNHEHVSRLVHARALEAAGRLAWPLGKYERARRFFEESLALSRQLQDKQGIADAVHGLGVVAEEQADFETAHRCLDESLRLYRELGDRRGLAASLNSLGNVVSGGGDYESARTLYRESLTIRRELNDPRGISTTLNNLAIIAYDLGDYREARTLFEETLELSRELGDPRSIAISLNNLGELAWREGDIAAARILQEEGLAMRRRLGDNDGVASSLSQLGTIAATKGDYATARSLYVESLVIRHEIQHRQGIAECFEKLAGIALAQGDNEPAARMFGFSENLREAMSAPLPPVDLPEYNSQVSELRSRMPEAALAGAWQEGRSMSPDEAVAYALESASSATAHHR